MKNRALVAALAALMSIILLAACSDPEPEETEASPTTGDAAAFEVEGTVRTVELENDQASPDANIRARLVIEVESMKAETAELCDVEEGDNITLTLTNQSAFDQDQEPEDLTELEGSRVRAEGNAEELAAGDGGQSQAGSPGGTETQDPEAGCHFEVAKISIYEGGGVGGIGDSTSSPTPAPAGSAVIPGANVTPGDE